MSNDRLSDKALKKLFNDLSCEVKQSGVPK